MMQTILGRSAETGLGVKISFSDGIIRTIEPVDCPADTPFLARGLVDLQVNGYGGIDFNAAPISPADVHDICLKLARKGVTQFLPTIITGSYDEMAARISAIAAAREHDDLVRNMVAGLHIEGPYISPIDGPRGAHPLAHVRRPSIDEFDHWQSLSNGLVKIVTLAPEHEGAAEYIRHITARGVIASIGHSAATPADIALAVAAGARMSTHLGNGAAAQLPRHPNLLWAQLAEDSLSAGLIADGHHLSAETFRVMLRAKKDAFLVSDTVALAGGQPGKYKQPIGDEVELTQDGKIVLSGTPFLAGAATALIDTIPRAMRLAGIDFATALALASTNPARLIGLGLMQEGEEANFIKFIKNDSEEIEIKSIFVKGEHII